MYKYETVTRFYNDIVDLIRKTRDRVGNIPMLNEPMSNLGSIEKTHSIEVALYSGLLGMFSDFSLKDVDTLVLGAYLHDIGKSKVYRGILNNPYELSDSDFQLIKKHVQLGKMIVEGAGCEREIQDIVQLHHEKIDGEGYPFGLVEGEIPEFVQIVTVCDIYSALSGTRNYKRKLSFVGSEAQSTDNYSISHSDAIREMQCGARDASGINQKYVKLLDEVLKGVSYAIFSNEEGL